MPTNSKGQKFDISNLPDRPYDAYLSRINPTPGLEDGTGYNALSVPQPSQQPDAITSSQTFDMYGNATVPVKAAQNLSDVWIQTFIKSTNWQPKKQGFWIDGPSGYAEFSNVFVSGNIQAQTGNIGGFVIGSNYISDVTGQMGLSSEETGSPHDIRFWAGDADPSNAPFIVYKNGDVVANSLTITGGTLSYGKTSFTDSTHDGYWFGPEGVYYGEAGDVSRFKYTMATGSFDFVGTISGRDSIDLATAIDSSANLVTNVINTSLNTASNNILAGFTFSPSDYSGAFKSGTITWNTSTGLVTGGSGILMYKNGIIGASGGTTTFAIDATTGAATFTGTVTGGLVRSAGSGGRIELSGSTNILTFYDTSGPDGYLFPILSGISGVGIAMASGFSGSVAGNDVTPTQSWFSVVSGSGVNTYAQMGVGNGSLRLDIYGNGMFDRGIVTGNPATLAAAGHVKLNGGFLMLANLTGSSATTIDAGTYDDFYSGSSPNGSMYYSTTLGAVRVKIAGTFQSLSTGGGGSGTVTNVSVVANNGITQSVATSTTTPIITLGLGAITPSSVSTGTVSVSGSGSWTSGGMTINSLTVSGTINTTTGYYISGTNVIDSSRNLNNIITATMSSNTTSPTFTVTGGSGTWTSSGLTASAVTSQSYIQINGTYSSGSPFTSGARLEIPSSTGVIRIGGNVVVSQRKTSASTGFSSGVVTDPSTPTLAQLQLSVRQIVSVLLWHGLIQ